MNTNILVLCPVVFCPPAAASHLTGAVFTCAETGRGTVMIRCTGIGHTRRTVAHTTGTSSGSVESGGGTGSGGPSLIDASFGDSTK